MNAPDAGIYTFADFWPHCGPNGELPPGGKAYLANDMGPGADPRYVVFHELQGFSYPPLPTHSRSLRVLWTKEKGDA